MTRAEFLDMFDGTLKIVKQLIQLIPDDKLDFKPYPGALTTGQLIGQFINDTSQLQGFLMITTGEWFFDPEEIARGPKTYTQDEGIQAVERDRETVHQIIMDLNENDFQTKLVTAAWGVTDKAEKMFNIVLLHHKHQNIMQMYMYLKMMGEDVDTGTLYLGAEPGTLDI